MGSIMMCPLDPTTNPEPEVIDATVEAAEGSNAPPELTDWVSYWRKALFPCRHLRLNPSEGKHFCPDCNEALVLTWVQLRCGSCRRRLPAMVLRSAHGDGLMCSDRCCSQCGSAFVPASHEAQHNEAIVPQAIEVEVIHDPQVFHLSHAVLAMRSAEQLTDPWPVSVMPEPLSVLLVRAVLCVVLMLGSALKGVCVDWLLPALATLCEPPPKAASMATE